MNESVEETIGSMSFLTAVSEFLVPYDPVVAPKGLIIFISGKSPIFTAAHGAFLRGERGGEVVWPAEFKY